MWVTLCKLRGSKSLRSNTLVSVYISTLKLSSLENVFPPSQKSCQLSTRISTVSPLSPFFHIFLLIKDTLFVSFVLFDCFFFLCLFLSVCFVQPTIQYSITMISSKLFEKLKSANVEKLLQLLIDQWFQLQISVQLSSSYWLCVFLPSLLWGCWHLFLFYVQTKSVIPQSAPSFLLACRGSWPVKQRSLTWTWMERRHLFATRRSLPHSDSGSFLHLWVNLTFSFRYQMFQTWIQRVQLTESIHVIYIQRWPSLLFHQGKKNEDIDPQASVCTPWPPSGPEEPDQEEAGQAAWLWSNRGQIQSELWGTGCGQHIQVDGEIILNYRLKLVGWKTVA